MRKVKRIFIGLIAVSLTVLTLFSVGTANAATSPYMSVRYDTYKLEDYENKIKYNEDYLGSLMRMIIDDIVEFSYGKNKTNVEGTISLNDLETDPDIDLRALWEDVDTFPDEKGTQSAYEYYGKYPSEIFGDDYTFIYSSNALSKPKSFEGEKYEAPTTSTFKPGDDIVIEPMITATGSLLGGGAFVIDHTSFAGDYSFDAANDFYANTSEYANIPVTTFLNGWPRIGWSVGTEIGTGFDAGTEVSAGGVHMRLDTGISGTFDIEFSKNSTAASSIEFVSSSGGDTAVYSYASDPDHFVETKGSITIQGASNKTGITDVTLNGTAVSNPTFTDYALEETVTTPQYTGTGGVLVGPDTYNAGDEIPVYTPTFTSPATGYTTNNVTLAATIEDLGSIAGVRYSTGENASIENALKNGTTASKTGSTYTIPMTGAESGACVYAVVDVVASDGVTYETYVFVLPKAANTTAKLSGITFIGNGTPNTVKLQNTSGANTTFSSGTTNYYIAVSDNTTSITVTPTFDESVYQTCKVNGVEIENSGDSTPVTVSSGDTISVVMTAQDGQTTETYYFTVKHLSANVSIPSIVVTADGQTYTATYDDASKTYTVNDVPYAIKNFTITPTFGGIGQTVKIGGTTMSNNVATGFTFSAGATNYAAWTETYTVNVTAEAGNTQNYTLNINRIAADTNVDLDDLVITDNEGNEIGTFDKATQTFTLTNQKLASTVTSVTAIATTDSLLAKVNVNSTNTDRATLTFSGVAEQVKTFTIVVTGENPNATETYTVNVTREKADDTTTFSVTASSDLLSSVQMSTDTSTNTVTNTTQLDYATSTVTLTINPEKDTTKIFVDGVDKTNTAFTITLPTTGNPKTISKTILVKTQANQNGHPYTVTITTVNADDTTAFTWDVDTDLANDITMSLNNVSKTLTNTTTLDYATTAANVTLTRATGTPETTKYMYNNVDKTGQVINLTFQASGNKKIATATIMIVTEANQTGHEYTITIETEQADDNFGFTASADANVNQGTSNSTNVNMTLSGSILSNTVKVDYETTSVSVTIVPDETTTKIMIDGTDYTDRPYILNITQSVDEQTVSKIFKVVTEANPSGYEYTIQIKTAQAEDNYNFTYEFYNTSNAQETQSPQQSGNTFTYTLNPNNYTDGKFKLKVTPASDKAKAYTSTDADNLKQSVYSELREFVIGEDIYVSVYSQYGNKRTYTIKTKLAENKDTDNKIQMITVNAGTLNYEMGQNDYLQSNSKHVVVPFTTTSITFTVTKNSTKSSFIQGAATVTETDLAVGPNTFYFQLKAENEVPGDIVTIEVVRESGRINSFVETLSINQIDTTVVNNTNVHTAFNKGVNVFDFVLPRNYTNAYVAFTVSDGATYRITESRNGAQSTSNNTNFSVPLIAGDVTYVKIEVWSEYNRVEDPTSPNVYDIYIYAASQDYSIDNIKIFKEDGTSNLLDVNNQIFTSNSSTTQPTFLVSYKTTTAFIKLKAHDQYADVADDGLKSLAVNVDDVAADVNEFNIVVTSEYQKLNPRMTSQTETYTVNIKRKSASTEDKLDTLEVYLGNETTPRDIQFQNTYNGPYKIENVPEDVTRITINHTALPLTTVTGDLGTITLDLVSNNSQTFHIYVQSEAGEENGTAPRDYQIIVSRQEVVLDSNCEIVNITATDGTGKLYLDRDSSAEKVFVSATLPYSISIPATLSGLTISIEKAVTTSKIYLDGNEITNLTFFQEVPEGQNKILRIKCIAQNGVAESGLYEITISRASYDDDPTLKELKVNGTLVTDFDPESNKIYTVNVPYGTTEAILEGITNKTTSTISSNDAPADSPYTLDVGDNLITITVAAEKPGTTKTYKVNVVRDADNSLSGLEVLDKNGNDLITFEATTTLYENITVPYSTDKVNINAIAVGGNLVTIEGDGEQELDEGLNELTVNVKTASGVIKPYTIKITREQGKTDNYIETYIDEAGNELSVNKTDRVYTYRVDRNINTFAPVITVSDGATLTLPTIRNIKLNEKNEFKVVVTSEKDEDREYTFIVYRAENIFDITDINVLDRANGQNVYDCNDSTKFIDYNSETESYEISVASTVTSVYLEVLTSGYYVVKYANGDVFTNGLISLDEGDNEFEIYVISEYASLNSDVLNEKSPTYKVNIKKEAQNTDSTFKEISVEIGGVTYTATPAELAAGFMNIENIGEAVTSANVIAIANVAAPKTTIIGAGSKTLASQGTDLDGNVTGYNFTLTLRCTAENPEYYTDFTIYIARGPLNLNDDNTLTYIEVKDSMDKVYLGENNFGSTTFPHSITIPYGPQSYTISVVKNAASPSTVSGTGQFAIQFTNGQDMVTTHIIQVTSTSGIPGDEYKITVTCKAPSSDATLKDLKADGVTVPGFTPENRGVYVLPTVPNSTTNIDITAITNDQNATITGNIGTNQLAVGQNTFSVTVTAQDGSSQLTYLISVVRDYPLPYVTNIEITGEKLLDEKDKETTFSKDGKEYHAIVTFMDETAAINVSVDNPTHVVSFSNASVITNTGLIRQFNVKLIEGVNRFTITVTSTEGKSRSYDLVIQRRGLATTNTNIAKIEIEEIPEFAEDFVNLQSVYEYTVPNKIKNLTVKVTCEHEGATYKVYNDKNLKAGLNQVIILVIAEDTETTRAVLVNVTRAQMEFTVNKEATEYTCKESDKGELKYVIDLGDKNAQAIQDYTKFIEFDAEDNLHVEVLTDTTNENCREVVVRVSDGSDEKLVHFELLTDAVAETSINYLVWVLLAIVIVILVIILICVNKDKYGKISKKRKNA